MLVSGSRVDGRNLGCVDVEGDAGAPQRVSARDAILEVAVRLLDERGPDAVTIDEVLVESGSSTSSLYHHFRNREGLLLAAQAERYRRMVQGEDRRNLDGGNSAETAEEFLAYVAGQVRRIVTDPDNVEVRRSRLQVAARALNAPELAGETRRMQQGMLEVIAAMFDQAQKRRLINPDLDTMAYAAWFHGMTLGRTVTEGGPVDAEAWLDVAIPAALAPLRLPFPPSTSP